MDLVVEVMPYEPDSTHDDLIRCTQDVLPKSGRRRRNAIKASRTFAEHCCRASSTELSWLPRSYNNTTNRSMVCVHLLDSLSGAVAISKNEIAAKE